ncbi:MAG: Lrp/AsnC family transcriptional regulator [Candidatus Promineifilaceae bacterium]
MAQLDTIDHQLLEALQTDSRASNADLARKVQLSPSGLQKRLKRLEAAGYIDQYTTLLNRKRLSLGLQCFVHVNLRHDGLESTADFEKRIINIPYVLECYRLTGEDDYSLKLIVHDVDHLQQLLRDEIASIPAVRKHRTSITLQQIKSTTHLPIKPKS